MSVKNVEERIRQAVHRGVKRGVVAGTELVRNEALRLILHTAKTGRLYQRRGRVHQASAPGEAPASDTGTLVRNITTRYSEDGKAFVGIVAAHTHYAASLEYGTPRMAPRPFMRPALANKREEIDQAVQAAVKQALSELR